VGVVVLLFLFVFLSEYGSKYGYLNSLIIFVIYELRDTSNSNVSEYEQEKIWRK